MIEKNMIDALVQHQANAYRLNTGEFNNLYSLFRKESNKVFNQLLILMLDLSEAEKTALSQGRYTTSDLKEIKTLFDDLYSSVATTVSDTFALSAVSYALYEANFTAKLYGESVGLTGESIVKKSLKTPLSTGQLVDDVWKDLAEKVRKKAMYTVRQGIVNGNTTQQIISELKGRKVGGEYVGGIVEQSRSALEANVRTLRSHVNNTAMMDTFSVLGFDFVKFLATLDGRVSKICSVTDSKVWAIGDPEIKRPPLHFNCIIGNSHVLAVGDISGVSKRWFDGEIIVIKTSAGRELSCTPNHPILTSDGWVAAKSINVGGNVISDLISDWVGISVSNHENSPTLIKHVVDSFLSSSKMISMPVPVSAEDFHGDGVGSKIAIVSTDSFLGNGINTSIKKHSSKITLAFRVKSAWSGLQSKCSFNKLIIGGFSASSSIVSLLNKMRYFSICSSSHASKLLFRSISCLNSMFCKASINTSNTYIESFVDSSNSNSFGKHTKDIGLRNIFSGSFIKKKLLGPSSGFDIISSDNIADSTLGNGEFNSDIGLRDSIVVKPNNFNSNIRATDFTFSDLISTLKENVLDDMSSGAVACGNLLQPESKFVGVDNILSIHRKSYSGYVYNLETDDGYYVANGIITHNCRSILVGTDKDGSMLGKRPFVEDNRPVSKIPKSEREGIIGQIDANTSFSEWFKTADSSFQLEWLGKKRYELYKNAEFTLDKFIDPLGRQYTLKELEALDSAVFKRLGL